ncbi:aldo/keto reductase [Nocardioides caeni]|uniref:Aldo/keto reductase n=1 Tax=Nocardioides caeni TaxID=574700 RepID=A0A4S8N020_9ACTN|nr:aldo/keto reductase [Nocardioides caeni]THV08812.1 aldo/keto reductase [Nocardioides caeni]
MEERYVGTSGLRVSRLALGTMTWGKDTDEHEARDQLTAFVGAGGTLVDTAAGYTDGRSEELLGSLIGDVVPREDLVIATKAGIWRRGSDRRTDTSRGALLRGLDTSLKRLGTDHVDLWQVHIWSDDVRLEETLGALDHAVASGRVSYIGISNYNGWQTARAVTWQELGVGRASIVSTQMEYSLVNRRIEREVLPAAGALGLGVLPWSPLGRGVLTGKYRTGTPGDSRAASPVFSSFVEAYLDDHSRGIVEGVARAADGLGWTPLEVALAWVRDAPGVTAPVVGARTAAQLKGALGVERRTLPPEIRAALDDVSRGAA